MPVSFILLDQYVEWEAACLSSALTGFGHEVRTASLRKDPVHSMGGLDSVPAETGGLILIGGRSWRGSQAGAAGPEFARTVLFPQDAAPEPDIRDWYHFHKLGAYTAPPPGM